MPLGGSIQYYHEIRIDGRRFDAFSIPSTVEATPISTYSEMALLLLNVCAGVDVPSRSSSLVLAPEGVTERDLAILNRTVLSLGRSSPNVRNLINPLNISTSTEDIDFRINCIYTSGQTSVAKYSFLELYRVIEAQFLHEIRLYFNANFLKAPKEVAKKVEAWVGSEREKIAEIADRLSMRAEFEFIYLIVEELSVSGNQFARAIDVKLRKENKKVEDWRKGALLVYFIRCSIVHAGQMDIRFEYYADADAVLSEIHDSMENIAYQLSSA